VSFHKRQPPAGSRPGTLSIPPGSPPPLIHVFDYDAHGCSEADVDDPEELRAYLASPRNTWVNVQGFGDEAKLRALAQVFSLRPLTLEDATNVPQRAKSEPGADYHIAIARAPHYAENGLLELPQVCMILGRNWLLTLQDRRFGFFDPVRVRLREGAGRPIRQNGPDYLLYALTRTLIDRYFPVVETLATELEEIEDAIEANEGTEPLTRLHQIRRQLVLIRRIGWPQREALRALVQDDSPFVTQAVQDFLRHSESQITQVMEAVDSARDTAMGLSEIHMATTAQRTNEVMKVLTLMASIFIPLTFVAGIYGMNFDHMPELHSRHAYPIALGAMAVMAAGMVAWFRHKGWLGSRRRGP
jgi:magnesium transporter